MFYGIYCSIGSRNFQEFLRSIWKEIEHSRNIMKQTSKQSSIERVSLHCPPPKGDRLHQQPWSSPTGAPYLTNPSRWKTFIFILGPLQILLTPSLILLITLYGPFHEFWNLDFPFFLTGSYSHPNNKRWLWHRTFELHFLSDLSMNGIDSSFPPANLETIAYG